MPADRPAPDPRQLRRAFGTFATGVTITATRDGAGQPVGFTANSFASVSLEPPLLMVCLAQTASSCPVFREAGRFAVNVLAETQRDLSTTFATRGADKFADVTWREEQTGAPVLDGVIAWFDCETHDLIPAGDHVILLGRVVAFDYAQGTPLGYCRGAYVRFGIDGAAFSSDPDGLRVGAIVECGGAVLLRESPGGILRLPEAPAFGPAARAGTLQGQLAAAGVPADLAFVFASYDDEARHHVVYRAILPPDAPAPATGWHFTPLNDLPADRLHPAHADLLRLYARERDAYAYGRYVGDAVTWSAGGDA
jgi:flavin reductase (DIM6/NTAB) family NADH-FMN oxidoreductase RutF